MCRIAAISLVCLLVLSGCGNSQEVKDTVTAPVDNIQKNVDYLQDTRKELRETAGKNADQTNKQIDDILNKNKKP